MKILIVADPNVCVDDFLNRIFKLCENGADAILFRTKYLSENEYLEFSLKILEICSKFGVEFIVNHFVNVALNLNSSLWLTSLNLQEILNNKVLTSKIKKLPKIYAPAHDMNEAINSAKIANILVASHIFDTSCKKGLEPKGVEFITNLKAKFDKEIYALGGINEQNFKCCLDAKASGICLMSSAMRCKNEREFLANFK